MVTFPSSTSRRGITPAWTTSARTTRTSSSLSVRWDLNIMGNVCFKTFCVSRQVTRWEWVTRAQSMFRMTRPRVTSSSPRGPRPSTRTWPMWRRRSLAMTRTHLQWWGSLDKYSSKEFKQPGRGLYNLESNCGGSSPFLVSLGSLGPKLKMWYILCWNWVLCNDTP